MKKKKTTPKPNRISEEPEKAEATDFSQEQPLIAEKSDDTDISSWYHHEDEGVDMTKIERKPKRKRMPIVIWCVVVGVLLAGIGFAYAMYRIQRAPDAGKAYLDLKVPEKTASGEAITLEVTYENRDLTAIKSGTIEIVYPDGFVFQSAQPEPTTGTNQWDIGGVEPGRGGKIYITGQLVGEVNSTQSFASFYTYRPENVNYDFQETSTKSCLITSSTIGVEVDVPAQARSGQEIELKAKFTNNAKDPLTKVKAIITPPDGFVVTSTDPEPDEDLTWRFEELQPGETQEVTLKGTISGDSGQQKQFSLEAGFVEFDGRFNAQVEKQQLVLIINPSIDMKIEGPETVAPGEKVTYSINVKNTSDVELGQIKIRVLLDGAYFDEKQIDIPAIEKLKPNDSTDVEASTTLKSTTDAQNLKLIAVASVRSVTVDGDQTTLTSTARQESTVAGSLSFSTQARYFADDLHKIGDGPIPPKVGEKTTYVIWWDVTSGPSDITQLTLSAQLPDSATFESGDGVIYDKKTRAVSYTASTLHAGDKKHVEFSVSITPTSDDFNTLMVLVESTQAQGVDSSSQDTLTQTGGRITTSLESDPGAAGLGVVQ